MKSFGPLIILSLALAVVMLALVGSARTEREAVPSLVLTVNGPVDGFAMDGGRFVYSGGSAREIGGCSTVELGTFGSHVHKRLGAEVLGAPNVDACNRFPLLIALGATRALWGGFEDCCNGGYGSVTTGAPGTKPRDLEGLGQTYHDTDGDFLTGVAGDGQTLVYAVVTVNVVRNFEGCFPATDPPPGPQTCDFKVKKWKLKKVVGGRALSIPNAPPAALLAVSGRKIMMIPADRSTATCGDGIPGNCPGSEPKVLRRFEIRSIGGSLLLRRNLTADATAIALSDRFAVVLVRTANDARIERYDSRSGRLIGRTTIPAKVADEMAISDRKVVYRLGKAISTLDARTGARTSLAVAKAIPIGLAIEGRRVAWVENRQGRGRVMSVMSPP